MKKIIISVFALLFVSSILFAGVGYYYNRPAGDGKKKIDFIVKPGMGPIVVNNFLHNTGMVRSRTFFRYALSFKGKKFSIKTGIYEIDNGMSSLQIINIITSGKSKIINITIPEGYNNRQIGDLLTERGFFKSRQEFLDAASDSILLKKYNIPAKTTEGYLFPDSYQIPADFPAQKLVPLMIETFLRKTKQLNGFPANNQERHKIVILASIVEREAQRSDERPIIAGIFQNRLRRRINLESCATVQYLFDKPKKRLLYRDLEIVSPYNTYLNKGLPPGPISNPGISSLKAAFRPDKNDFLFFVLQKNGRHHFSKNFSSHEAAKKKYLERFNSRAN